MSDYVDGKSIVISGAASGFGRLISEKLAGMGANVTCCDINEDGLSEVVTEIERAGGSAQYVTADVTDLSSMKSVTARAVTAYGGVDVMINNAGIMPLAFFSDHVQAASAWHRCIDINIKGVLNGMIAAYDPMIEQARGHVINISSIYGNFPVVGAAVYGATKAAVNTMSEALRLESRGKIKVTTVKPTGVPTTGLVGSVVNLEAAVGIVGENVGEFMPLLQSLGEGTTDPALLDPEGIGYAVLDPTYIADAVIHAIDQPWGVSLGEITIRASGDHYKL
ncbi:MAG: SDR family oxidoreductase [Hyphomonas sp.]